MEGAPLLRMVNIRKRFGPIEVLHGISFDLAAGEVHALVGHNGAGKSTLINVLGGVFSDYEGDVHVDGNPVSLRTPHTASAAGVALIHQEFSFIPRFTVAQNIALGKETRRFPGLMDHAESRRSAMATLEDLGFDLPIDVPVGDLSVAKQQLTEIARALGTKARIIVMDEPTSRLPTGERQELFNLIRQVTASGTGIIYISHFLDEVLEIADRVTVLRDGHVIQTGMASEFRVESLAQLIVGDTPELQRSSKSVLSDAVVLRLIEFGERKRPTNSLELHRGQVLGLAGLVGSGRSSILESIIGARRTRGTLEVNGKTIPQVNPTSALRAGISLVPEDRKSKGVVMTGTVRENIALSALSGRFARWGFVLRSKLRGATSESFHRFRVLAPNPDVPARSLSGGNQQKAILARGDLTEPNVLLLDQPTAGIDVGARSEIYERITRMAHDGVAFIIASDEISELLEICHTIAVVRAGVIVDMLDASTLTEHDLLARISVKEVAK